MSSTVGSRSGPGSKKYVDFDEMVAIQLEKARSGIRANDLLMGAVGLGVFLAAYLAVFLFLDHWVFAQGVGAVLRVVMWLGVVGAVAGWIGWKVAVPYLRRVSSLFAAKEIELTRPELKSNLLTLVDLRQAGRPVSPQILQAIEKRAAVSLADLDIDHAIDRRSLMRWSYILLGIVALLCVYTLLSPKRLGPSLLRALVPIADVAVGTQTRIEKVTPGDATVLSRSQVTIETQLTGKIPAEVRVLYSTEDRRFVDEPLILNDTGEGLNRFRGTLTGERGKGLLQSLTYHVVAGDAISPTFAITVTQPPSATVLDVAYDYPAYMGLEDRTQANPTIDAWEGTKITLRAVANRPVSIARILFSDSEETSIKAEEIAMKIEDGINLSASWPLQLRSDGTYPHFYRLHVETADGSRDPQPTLFPLKIRADLAPKVEIFHPQSDVTAPANGSVQVAWQAGDPDFQLKDVLLRYEKRGQELPEVDTLFESPPQRPSAKGLTSIDLKRFDLRTGDKLTFWIEARDNLEPFGERRANVAKTPRMNITIVDPVDPQQAEKKAQEDKQNAQEKLDQAPPPPQEDRANPDEGRPQPDQDPDREQQPKPNADEQPMPREGDPKPQQEMGDERKPMEGEPQQGSGDKQGQSGAEGSAPPQPDKSANGTGKTRPDGKSTPPKGTPQEQRPEDMTNPDGSPKDAGTGGGPGSPKPPRPGQTQGEKRPNESATKPEGQPQSEKAEEEGSESQSGAGTRKENTGAKPSSNKTGGGRDNKASDEEALNKLFDNAQKKSAREKPQESTKPAEPEPELSEGGSPPMNRTKPEGGGSNGRSAEEKKTPPKPGDRTGAEPMPTEPSPGTGSDSTGAKPSEKGGTPKGSDDRTKGGMRDPSETTPGPKPEEGAGAKKPDAGTGEAGKTGPDKKAGPDQANPGKTPGDKTGTDKTESGKTDTGKPDMGKSATKPDGTGMPEMGPGGKPDAGMKPGPGEKNPPETASGEKNATEKDATGKTGTDPKTTERPQPAGKGADSTNPPKVGEGAPMPSVPMPGASPGAKSAPTPNGAGEPKTGEDKKGTDPAPGMPPMPGAGPGEPKPGTADDAKPDPKSGTPGDDGKPGAKPTTEDPANPPKGNDPGMKGTEPRPGEKAKPGTGEKGGEKTGEATQVKPSDTPMGTKEDPAAKSTDPKTQQSPDPMQGMKGTGAPSSEGQAGSRETGPGDTTKRPGQEGAGESRPQNENDPKSAGGPKGAGKGTRPGEPMEGAGTQPGGSRDPMPGETGKPDGGTGGKSPMKTGTGEPMKSVEPGGGEPKSAPGAKQPDKKTGGPKGTEGSPQSEGSDPARPGESPDGPPMKEGQPGGASSNPSGDKEGPSQQGPKGKNEPTQPKPGAGEKPGEAPKGDQPGGEKGGGQQPGKQPGGKSADGPMGPGGNQPGSEAGPPSGSPSTPSGNQPGRGGGPGGEAPPEGKRTEASQPGQGDEGTDLENKKKAINLMLKRMQDELRRGEADPELLKELGFNESELQQFLKRVDQQLNSADDETPEGLARRRQFEEMLKGLGADTQGETRGGGEGPRQASGGFGARNSTAPAEYAREAEAYKKRLSQKKAAAK